MVKSNKNTKLMGLVVRFCTGTLNLKTVEKDVQEILDEQER